MHAGGRGRGGDLVDGGLIEPEELALVDGDERLPWLEADEDFDENEVDTGRVIAFVLVGLLFLGLIIGGLWLYFRESTDSAIIADGSTIEAPDEPYKTRPQNPGGAEALGTGGGVEHAVLAHEGHQRIDVVAVPGVAESGKGVFGDGGRSIVHGAPEGKGEAFAVPSQRRKLRALRIGPDARIRARQP